MNDAREKDFWHFFSCGLMLYPSAGYGLQHIMYIYALQNLRANRQLLNNICKQASNVFSFFFVLTKSWLCCIITSLP
jgi:hypothetical protein